MSLFYVAKERHHPPQVTVKCLQVIVRSVDAKTLAKNLPEFIRTSMLTFFNNAAIDMEHCIQCLQEVRGGGEV